jgi:hypothetical protein
MENRHWVQHKRMSRVVLIMIFACSVIVGLAAFLFFRNSAVFLYSLDEKLPSVLYVSQDSLQDEGYSGTGDQRVSIWQLAKIIGKEDKLVRVGQFTTRGQSFPYSDGSLFFINSQEQIAAYNLHTHETTLIPSPTSGTGQSVSPTTSRIHDIWLAEALYGSQKDRMLFVLQGSCGTSEKEDRDCKLFARNIRTGDYRLVADVASIIDPPMGIAFGSYAVGGSIPLQSVYSDAGHANGKRFSVEYWEGYIKQMSAASYEYCETACDSKVLTENSEYIQLFPSEITHRCTWIKTEEDPGTMKIFVNTSVRDAYGQPDIVSKLKMAVPYGHFVTCIP